MGYQDPPNSSSATSILEFCFQILPRPPQSSRQSHHLPFQQDFLKKSPVPLAPPYLEINLWKYFWHQIFLWNITPEELHNLVWIHLLVFSIEYILVLGEKKGRHYEGKCGKGKCANDSFLFRTCLEKVFLWQEGLVCPLCLWLPRKDFDCFLKLSRIDMGCECFHLLRLQGHTVP